ASGFCHGWLSTASRNWPAILAGHTAVRSTALGGQQTSSTERELYEYQWTYADCDSWGWVRRRVYGHAPGKAFSSYAGYRHYAGESRQFFPLHTDAARSGSERPGHHAHCQPDS